MWCWDDESFIQIFQQWQQGSIFQGIRVGVHASSAPLKEGAWQYVLVISVYM